MDKDRVEGAAHRVKGAVKEAVGKVTGDAKTRAEGAAEKAAGKVQNAVGGAKTPFANPSRNDRGSARHEDFIAAAASGGRHSAGPRPAAGPHDRGARPICTEMPTGTTVTNFYKQNVYDADNKIGDVDDVLIDKEGKVTAMIIAVGGFLGMGEKDVAVPFSSVRASEKNNKWYLPRGGCCLDRIPDSQVKRVSCRI